MKLVLWDFDGTLAYRDGIWSGAFLEIIQRVDADFREVTVEEVRAQLRVGYPWHEPDKPHTHIRDSAGWWDWMAPVFEAAFRGLGCDAAMATSALGR